ncbi:hypothetical protein [Acidipropionibacterium acidipropionici]|uniref:hypothetical protein n=1 Tax=Acidipropionibacterium acidipropionici TaxID=1748 RepID=UPI0004900222|nr:hypothetical protein [Acidipropionibacterium acidipropionici]ALN14363.1 hypothetical protein ASQ49_02730 [Acidipropionibacterium acidipropionici]APZ09875.1 hypothetical protein BWX38_12220 [Acidipropionibacterium acidipropionici]
MTEQWWWSDEVSRPSMPTSSATRSSGTPESRGCRTRARVTSAAVLAIDKVAPVATIILHHFTCVEHLDAILADRVLHTTESNVSQRHEHAGPDVVWLTTRETADGGLGLQGSRADKGAVRITVRLDTRRVSRWREWARAHGSSEGWIRTLAQTGGGSSSWRVTERPIQSEEWVEVRNVRTGEIIPIPGSDLQI